ncbi:DNA repair protein Rad60 isoform X2 [Condylostylus longicornis]|uniref:DNA repair protein Rad60 isoform X2 n=1 Tax=Condylostylus longicornis TaxID=2530218 RepID=UPI00244DBCE5|nr:DNA repair protein Rad60 isoform X2 [Condylostylus longicornis]
MDSFEYDCLDGLNKFCSNENAIEKQIERASKYCEVELSDDDLEESTESSKKIAREKKKTKSDKIEISGGDFEESSECIFSGDITNEKRILRSSLRSRKSKRNNLIEVDLTKCDEPRGKNKKKVNNNIIQIDIDDSLECISPGRVEKCSSFLSDTEKENIIINIQWKNAIEKMKHRKFQKFFDLMNIYAKRENCSVNDILFNIENKIINPDDTPYSIDYKLYDIITGRVVPNCNNTPSKKDKNGIVLKVQSNNWKKIVEISINKDENFSILSAKLAEELKINIKNFTLIFDGEPMDLKETPTDLDFEGGELIDCKIKNDESEIKENKNLKGKEEKQKKGTRQSKRKAKLR